MWRRWNTTNTSTAKNFTYVPTAPPGPGFLVPRTWNDWPGGSNISKITIFQPDTVRDKSTPTHISRTSQAAWVYKLSPLSSPWVAGTVQPWGGGNCITTPWNQFYENWRLECIPSGRMLLTAVPPPARVTRLSSIPWWQDGVLEHHCVSASRWPKPAEKDLPWSKKKEVLGDLHGGPLRVHLGVNKTLNTARKR
jgi:hypothetical protein